MENVLHPFVAVMDIGKSKLYFEFSKFKALVTIVMLRYESELKFNNLLILEYYVTVSLNIFKR